MEFKTGEIVLFSTSDNGNKTNVGMILKQKDNGNYVVLTQYSTAYKDIKLNWITSIDNAQEIRDRIILQYNKEINNKQQLIRKVTQEEKDTEKETKYRKLQQEIKVLAKRLSESADDADFENRLKAITELKKNIFSIELECDLKIRKDNGAIKYDIKILENNRDAELRKISDESIGKAFDF